MCVYAFFGCATTVCTIMIIIIAGATRNRGADRATADDADRRERPCTRRSRITRPRAPVDLIYNIDGDNAL